MDEKLEGEERGRLEKAEGQKRTKGRTKVRDREKTQRDYDVASWVN